MKREVKISETASDKDIVYENIDVEKFIKDFQFRMVAPTKNFDKPIANATINSAIEYALNQQIHYKIFTFVFGQKS